MTQDEIIEMAKQAGWEMDDSLVLEPEIVWYISQGQLEAFAKLIAQHEREACAKIAEEPWQGSPKAIAEQIRERKKE
jgi:hypothetical protein